MPSPDAENRLQPRPASGYVFCTSWPVATGDIDGELHLRLDGVARYVQEVGAQNLVDAGEAEEHPHWLVQRTVIDVIEPIEWPNDLTLHRWCSALSTRWCTMRVGIEGAEGGRIETEGFWIAINERTLTPQRVSDSLIARFASTTEVHRLRWRPWLDDPDDADSSLPFALRRTDIDIFEHVTNTAYWHAVHEVMAVAPEACRAPFRAVVEYRKPIKYGEDVTIRFVRRDQSIHAALCVGDEVRAAVLVRSL